MKLKLLEKAYELDRNRVVNGYQMSEIIVFADSRGKAKQKILNNLYLDEHKVLPSFDKLSFINLPIQRAKNYDNVLHKGEKNA